MQINNFCNKFLESETFRRKSRLLIIPNQEETGQIRDFLIRSAMTETVRISDCITQNNFLPAPGRLFIDLKQKIKEVNQKEKTAVVLGWDAIMELWAVQPAKEGYIYLRDLLENPEINCLFISNYYSESTRETFESNPRYKEGQTILFLGNGGTGVSPLRTIRLIAQKFQDSQILGKRFNSLSKFIQEHEDDLLLANVANIFIESTGKDLAGIREEILQIHSRKHFLKVFCGLEADLSESAIDWLYNEIHETGVNALAFLQQRFCEKGVTAPETLKTVPQQIAQASPQVAELLVWMLKSSLPSENYLYKVLFDLNFKCENFLSYYVNEVLNLLEHPRVKEYAKERKEGLEQIGLDKITGILADFIRQSQDKSNDLIVPWLNLQTDIEKHELLRRVKESTAAQIPKAILEGYPLLKAYMEPYQLGRPDLNQYFEEYRLLKIKNTVTEEFCNKVRQIQINLSGIKARDYLIQQYANMENTELIVVDGMGAEYLPLIIALAQQRNLGIQIAKPAYVKLPTSTEFNPIQWPGKRQDIKELDNILHNGAEMHNRKEQEENFAASLKVFNKQIFQAVSEAMTRVPQVILTADHGATRLAVLAHQNGLAKTILLPKECCINDWRYTQIVPEVERNDVLEKNLAGTHWCVKGYNRLVKQGPKFNEMHGGATYEERLVPFVVFKPNTDFVSMAQQTTITDIDENDDFDL